MNIVYTYYEPVDQIDNRLLNIYTQYDLIKVCKESWLRNGWDDLVVLSHKDAQQHQFYEQYNAVIETLPSVNPNQYDYHCYMRWLAMAQIGGGLMIDYDVVNHSFSPQEYINLSDQKTDKIQIYQGHVPCVVNGTSDQYLSICEQFVTVDVEECLDDARTDKHTSDMLMLSKSMFAKYIHKVHYVKDYPKLAPLIHCSQYHCFKQNQTTKYDAMKNIAEK